MQNIPAYLTIDNKVFFRWGSYNDLPKWRYTNNTNLDLSIIYYQNDWKIVDEAALFNDPTSTPLVSGSLTGDGYIDTTQSSFTECRCFSFSAIIVSGAGLSNVNGKYVIDNNTSDIDPNINNPLNKNSVLGKSYRIWTKRGGSEFIMLQGSMYGLSAKAFTWSIYGARIPFSNAPAYINTIYKPFSNHDTDINCPPTINWVAVPGANAGSAPTLTLIRDSRY